MTFFNQNVGNSQVEVCITEDEVQIFTYQGGKIYVSLIIRKREDGVLAAVYDESMGEIDRRVPLQSDTL